MKKKTFALARPYLLKPLRHLVNIRAYCHLYGLFSTLTMVLRKGTLVVLEHEQLIGGRGTYMTRVARLQDGGHITLKTILAPVEERDTKDAMRFENFKLYYFTVTVRMWEQWLLGEEIVLPASMVGRIV